MNQDDYVLEMDDQLKVIFTHSDSITFPFYECTTQKNLEKIKQSMSTLMQTGVSQNIVSGSDAKKMEPKGTQARLNGNPKMHKPIKENKRIPPCHSIISNSGSNLEYTSEFIDIHSKHLVKELESFVEDGGIQAFKEALNHRSI